MQTCKTVKVKPWGQDQGDFVEINESEFNPEVHERFGDEEPKAKKAKAETKSDEEPKAE